MTVLTGPNFAAYGSGGWSRGPSNQTVVDKVLPEMLHLVDAHWYQFPPMNPLWHAILGFVIGCLGCVSVIGNGMVVFIFTSTKNLRTPSNLLVINCFYETWVFGPLMCQLYACAGSLFGCTSIWSMTAIAFDRYNVIVKGLAAKPMTIGGALLRILGIWLFCLAWTIFPLFGWNRYVPEGNMTACGTDYITKDWFSRSYILAYSVFVYYLPLFLIIYSYYFIISAVTAHEKNMREQAKKMNVASLRSQENQNQSAECKLAKVALTTISLWFMAWTPYLVINYAGIFETITISPLFTIWGSVFAKANAVYNPIVYGISHPKYRAALFARFPSLACADKSSDGDAISTATTTTEGEKANA
ncbi:hypothetical protein G9C98_007898 [Cotesia typhae]|uniref:G-protein coupled receptors family 1 profile domain-containing protein n=1 Tax=Cotesia typhae TaxID=2053667 RepID=A0A8J5QVZ8_9HYME|nr:hypothetical protein G9C98_007898 [Cotesia typhae]